MLTLCACVHAQPIWAHDGGRTGSRKAFNAQLFVPYQSRGNISFTPARRNDDEPQIAYAKAELQRGREVILLTNDNFQVRPTPCSLPARRAHLRYRRIIPSGSRDAFARVECFSHGDFGVCPFRNHTQDHIREQRISKEWFDAHVVSYLWLGQRNQLMLNLPHTADYPHL